MVGVVVVVVVVVLAAVAVVVVMVVVVATAAASAAWGSRSLLGAYLEGNAQLAHEDAWPKERLYYKLNVACHCAVRGITIRTNHEVG